MVADQKTTLGKKNSNTAAFFASAPGKAVANAFQKRKIPQYAMEEKMTVAPLRVGPVPTNKTPVMM